MSQLTQDDIMFLKEYGVKTVIDLRSDGEVLTHGNPLAAEEFCNYFQIPLMTKQVTNITMSQIDMTIGDFYVELLEQTDAVKEIFKVISEAEEEGCIVFHCQAGKDRTGVLAMLLLGLVGVEKKDIITNYEVTYSNLESLHEIKTQYEHIPESFLYSSRDSIIKAYEYILHTYETVEQYLLTRGVEIEVIERVKDRLVGEREAVVLEKRYGL